MIQILSILAIYQCQLKERSSYTAYPISYFAGGNDVLTITSGTSTLFSEDREIEIAIAKDPSLVVFPDDDDCYIVMQNYDVEVYDCDHNRNHRCYNCEHIGKFTRMSYDEICTATFGR